MAACMPGISERKARAACKSRGAAGVQRHRPHAVTFRWKDKKNGAGPQVGLIAQEVEPLYPEIVGTDSGGMKSIGYAALTVPLIKAVQEQQGEIAALKAANANMQHELDALKAQSGR